MVVTLSREIERQWVSPVAQMRPALDAGEQALDTRPVARRPGWCRAPVRIAACLVQRTILRTGAAGHQSSASERRKASESGVEVAGKALVGLTGDRGMRQCHPRPNGRCRRRSRSSTPGSARSRPARAGGDRHRERAGAGHRGWRRTSRRCRESRRRPWAARDRWRGLRSSARMRRAIGRLGVVV